MGFYVTERCKIMHGCEVNGNGYIVLTLTFFKNENLKIVAHFAVNAAAHTAAIVLMYCMSLSDLHTQRQIVSHSTLQNDLLTLP